MPKAKLMLIACDDETDSIHVRNVIQSLTDNCIVSAGVDVAIDSRELEAPIDQVIPQLMEPMLMRLRQMYPPPPPR